MMIWRMTNSERLNLDAFLPYQAFFVAALRTPELPFCALFWLFHNGFSDGVPAVWAYLLSAQFSLAIHNFFSSMGSSVSNSLNISIQ